MAGSKSQSNKAELMLGLLKAVHENESLTQRGAAQQIGVALGLVNTYLKRCIKKGYVKVVSAPRSRYSYYLTPKGFAEKSRLTAEYLSVSFNLFRTTRAQYSELFGYCERMNWSNIVFAGVGDLTDIALMCASGSSVKPVGFIDQNFKGTLFHNFPVKFNANAFKPLVIDSIVITDLIDPQGTYEAVEKQFTEKRILAPDMLNVSRSRDIGARAS